MSTPKEGDLRVCHIPQVPGKPFHVPVSSPRDGALVLRALATYDLFQFENRIKPDYYAQWLDVFEDGEWCEWCSEEGDGIEDVAEMLLGEAS